MSDPTKSDARDSDRYKCPIAGAQQTFPSYEKDLKRWRDQCALDKKAQASHIIMRGFSNNEEFSAQIELLEDAKLNADDGFTYLCETMTTLLHEGHSMSKVRRYRQWKTAARQPQESFKQLLTRWLVLYQRVKTDNLFPISAPQAAFELLFAFGFTETQFIAISQKVALDENLTVQKLQNAVSEIVIVPAQAADTKTPSNANFVEPDGIYHVGPYPEVDGSNHHAYPDSRYEAPESDYHWDSEHGYLTFQGLAWDEETQHDCHVYYSEYWQEDVMWNPVLHTYLAQDQCRWCLKRTNPPHWEHNCPERKAGKPRRSGKTGGKAKGHGKSSPGKGSYLADTVDGSNHSNAADAYYFKGGKSKGKGESKGKGKGKSKGKPWPYAHRTNFRPYSNHRAYWADPPGVDQATQGNDSGNPPGADDVYDSWANYLVPDFTYMIQPEETFMAVPEDASAAAEDQSANGPDPADEDFGPDWNEADEEARLERALDEAIAAKSARVASPEVQTKGKVLETWQPSLRHQTDVSDVKPSLPQSRQHAITSRANDQSAVFLQPKPRISRHSVACQTPDAGLPPLERLKPLESETHDESWTYHHVPERERPDDHRPPRHRYLASFHARYVILPSVTILMKIKSILKQFESLDAIVLTGLCPEQCTPGREHADNLIKLLSDNFPGFFYIPGDCCLVMYPKRWTRDPDSPPLVLTNASAEDTPFATAFFFKETDSDKPLPSTFRFGVGTMYASAADNASGKLKEHATPIWLGDLDSGNITNLGTDIKGAHPEFATFASSEALGCATLQGHWYADVLATTDFSAIFQIEQQRGSGGAGKKRRPAPTADLRANSSKVPRSFWTDQNGKRFQWTPPNGEDTAYPLYDANLSVPLEPGEVTYDPGCTAETGSVQAWEKLNTEMIAKYGAGFDIGDSDAQFRVADGSITKALRTYTAAFDIPGKGLFTFAGSALQCGEDPKSHTPILFGNGACKSLGLVMDHDDGTLYSKRLDVSVTCRPTVTGHWAVPIFALMDKAGARLSKNGHVR